MLSFQEFVNTMRGVSGHVGKILVYKSGKVKFKIGDYLYDVWFFVVVAAKGWLLIFI